MMQPKLNLLFKVVQEQERPILPYYLLMAYVVIGLRLPLLTVRMEVLIYMPI